MDFLFLTNNQHLGLNAVVVWHPGGRSRSALGLQAIASIAWRGETCNLCTEGSGGRVSRGGLDPRTGPGPSWVSHRGFVWQWELGGANGWGGRGGKWKNPFTNYFWEFAEKLQEFCEDNVAMRQLCRKHEKLQMPRWWKSWVLPLNFRNPPIGLDLPLSKDILPYSKILPIHPSISFETNPHSSILSPKICSNKMVPRILPLSSFLW